CLPTLPPPPPSTLFPYTTLFRSVHDLHDAPVLELVHRELDEGVGDREGDRRGHAEQDGLQARTGLPGPGDEQEGSGAHGRAADRSEEHTSELQSRGHLVCRLLLE